MIKFSFGIVYNSNFTSIKKHSAMHLKSSKIISFKKLILAIFFKTVKKTEISCDPPQYQSRHKTGTD
jgi:hypothetical protein